MSTPRAVSCPKYEALPGSRRCRHYVANGACELPDEFMCVEWQKVNGHVRSAATPTPPPLERDLFGAPYVPPAEIHAAAPAPAPTAAPPATTTVNVAALAGIQALGVEVHIESDELGELWLVPAYTGADRQELSFEHGALLATLCTAMPSARITALVRKAKQP